MPQPLQMVVASTRGPQAPERSDLAALLDDVRERGMPLNLNDDPLVAPGGYFNDGHLREADDGAQELVLTGHMIDEVLLLQDASSIMARRAQVRQQVRELLAAAGEASTTIILNYDESHYRSPDLERLQQPGAGPDLTVRPFQRRSQRSLPVLELGIPLSAVAAGWFGGPPGEASHPEDPHFRQQLAAAALSCQPAGGAEQGAQPPTLVFSLSLEGRALQGVSRSHDASVLSDAGRGLGELLVQGLSWQSALSDAEIGRMVFRFGGESRRWAMHYALFADGELLVSEPADALRQQAMQQIDFNL